MEARKTARTARPIESQPQTHSTDTTILETVKRQVATTDFIKVEKNLASLGFFTPSNKKIRGTKEKKISITRQADGNRIEVRAVILPSAAYGLPITGDQDKYFALQKIICDIRRQKGEISNPVGFTSAELLRILGLRVTAGKNYEDIVSWARRMTLTGICSEGIIYLAGRKVWASDTFHVFERFVSVGNQMPDGSIADKHYVWLSDWQLENINNNHVFPVDLEVYRRLKNHIAKALVPLLQIWLYATREGGSFEKRYRDLCQILNICQYQHLSKIKEKVGPSLEELTKHHYLAGWQIRETSDGADFKIIFYHGEKFNRDQLTRMDRMLKTSPRATEACLYRIQRPGTDVIDPEKPFGRGVGDSGRSQEARDAETRSVETPTRLQTRHLGASSPTTSQSRHRNRGTLSHVRGVQKENANAKHGRKTNKVSRLARLRVQSPLDFCNTQVAKNIAPKSSDMSIQLFRGQINS